MDNRNIQGVTLIRSVLFVDLLSKIYIEVGSYGWNFPKKKDFWNEKEFLVMT